MSVEPLESENTSLVGYDDLDGRPGFKMALKRVDDRWLLYLAHFFYSGWSIVDVTDPTDPTLVDFIEGPENTMTLQIQIADDLMITSLEKPREGFGPVDDLMDPSQPYEEGAYVWDLSDDPTDPELVGHYETGGAGTHRNFYNGGDYAYMCAHTDEFEGGILTVVDVSDPSDPTEVTKWWWPGQSPEDDEPADHSFYFHGPAYVQGDRAYLAYGRVGPVTLDVSDPTAPELVNRLAMGDGWGSWLGTHSYIPVPDSEYAVINTEAILGMRESSATEPLNYTALLDISDERQPGFTDDAEPVGPKVLSTMPLPSPESHLPYANYYEKGGSFGPHNQHHHRGSDLRYRSSDYLVMTWFNAGLRIFDITDPRMPTEAAYFVAEDPDERIGTRPKPELVSHFEDVVVDARGNIYCTDPNRGLFVIQSSILD